MDNCDSTTLTVESWRRVLGKLQGFVLGNWPTDFLVVQIQQADCGGVLAPLAVARFYLNVSHIGIFLGPTTS